jgi:hypothetical protein
MYPWAHSLCLVCVYVCVGVCVCSYALTPYALTPYTVFVSVCVCVYDLMLTHALVVYGARRVCVCLCVCGPDR